MENRLNRKFRLSKEYTKGKSIMRNSIVSICSLVRDCEKELVKNIPRIERLRMLFKNSEVIVFENDSKDNSREVLLNWKRNSFNIYIYSETFGRMTIPSKDLITGNPFFSTYRIEKMAKYRNKYMHYLNNQGIDRDFVIALDLDIANFSIDGIIHSFGSSQNWDCITSNGISISSSLRKQYHDSYALIEYGQIDQIQTERSIFFNRRHFSYMKKGMPLILVDSAYGGLAIYKWSSLKGIYYSNIINNDLNVQSKSEHVSIHKKMIEKGHHKIFINPSMILKYRSVTIPFLIKKITAYLARVYKL